jgi:hypothetical protein
MHTTRNLDKTVTTKELELRTLTIINATRGSTRAFTGKKILQQSLPVSRSTLQPAPTVPIPRCNIKDLWCEARFSPRLIILRSSFGTGGLEVYPKEICSGTTREMNVQHTQESLTMSRLEHLYDMGFSGSSSRYGWRSSRLLFQDILLQIQPATVPGTVQQEARPIESRCLLRCTWSNGS